MVLATAMVPETRTSPTATKKPGLLTGDCSTRPAARITFTISVNKGPEFGAGGREGIKTSRLPTRGIAGAGLSGRTIVLHDFVRRTIDLTPIATRIQWHPH